MRKEYLFKDAEFGDKFKTRDGRCATLRTMHYTDDILDECYLVTSNDDIYVGPRGISKIGRSCDDIIDRWANPIDTITKENLIDIVCKWMDHHNTNKSYITETTTGKKFISGGYQTDLRAFINDVVESNISYWDAFEKAREK